MSIDFRQQPLTEIAALVARRELCARDLVGHALDRIAAFNPGLNAFVAVDGDAATKRAVEIDAALAAGHAVGPLAGIPIGVKDLEDATGFVTSQGSATHAGDAPAARDSVLVARLKAAGCIVLGKTNTPEFGLKPQTDNPTFGITGNPHDPTRTPGGSSGGSAAAVGAGMVPLATGSDGGGSIRIPSAACGLSGFKPSLGRVPTADPAPPGWMELSTRGVIARRIADVGAALDVVRGPHPHDLRSLPADGDSWAAAASAPTPPSRVAWCPTLGYAEVDREVTAACEAALNVLEQGGCTVSVLDRVFTDDPGPTLGTLVSAYMYRTVEPFRGTEFWDRLDPLVVISAEVARLTGSLRGLLAAEDARHLLNRQLAEVFEHHDVLLCPTMCGQIPWASMPVTMDELLVGLGAAVAESPMNPTAIDELLEFMRAHEPINFPMGAVDGTPVLDWTRLTQPFNLTRSPAGTVNAGTTADGMPVGLQVIGPQHGDVVVLQTLAWLEQALP